MGNSDKEGSEISELKSEHAREGFLQETGLAVGLKSRTRAKGRTRKSHEGRGLMSK